MLADPAHAFASVMVVSVAVHRLDLKVLLDVRVILLRGRKISRLRVLAWLVKCLLPRPGILSMLRLRRGYRIRGRLLCPGRRFW